MTMHELDCTALDERLADYLEGELASADRRQLEAHLASCVRCTALVRDLEQIRAGAASLPELSPASDLWSGIARRIDAPVVPFTARQAPNVIGGRRTLGRWKSAAIAAALVAVTAGVTYTLTVARHADPSARTIAAAQTTQPARTDTGALTNDDTTSRAVAAVPNAADSQPRTQPSPSKPERPTNPLASAQAVANSPAAPASSQEIDRLRTVFARNRSRLDPRTAAIIEANLKVIDDAIAQSKAALAQDPASKFLSEQLNSALDKKRELLKTAALLPNRT